MTVRKSRSFLSISVAGIFLLGCQQVEKETVRRCQLLVILDKTASVNYTQKREKIHQALTRDFARTYASATKDIQSSLLVITGNTVVFPEPFRFDVDKPMGEEGSRIYQQSLLEWHTGKRKWLSGRIDDICNRIDSPCRSTRTDIFSIFSGIAQVQKDGGPWDSVVVDIFSDMVNTSRTFNMATDTSLNNAREKGKTVCADLMQKGVITPVANENLHLTIYTPDSMVNTGAVNQFWAGFFEHWGLKPNQYRFED